MRYFLSGIGRPVVVTAGLGCNFVLSGKNALGMGGWHCQRFSVIFFTPVEFIVIWRVPSHF